MADLTKYDAVFSQAASGSTVPPLYLRALAVHESNLNPEAIGPGKETGLMQIHPVTLKAYNQSVGKDKQISSEQSKDPLTSAQIAVWLIKRISSSFAKNHPNTLQENWSLERYVGLVTQAYNAGESESAGVGALVGTLEKQGISAERITYLTVAQANNITHTNKWLSEDRRLRYVKAVVDDFFKFVQNPEQTPVKVAEELPAPKVIPSAAVPDTGGPEIKKS